MTQFTTYTLFFLSFLTQTDLRPVLKPPSPTAIDYMRRYGYLEGVGTDVENLYKEETIVNAIKTMQKYGGLKQTGIIDKETVALFSKPRCGVSDVNQPSKQNRTKRFIIGSEGWKKRVVTYFIANWSPKLGDRVTETQVQKAFELWGGYSGLKFKQKYDNSADIILFFARGPHGDGYAMDGPGNILAHAFYPYEHGSYGGDVHFDEDEDWVNGLDDGFDFLTVAAHEIGHSLGLAHSHEPNSLMFPYYKGFNPDFRLGYDDILGVYQLYVSRPFEEEEVENYPNTNDRSESDDESRHEDEQENDDEDKDDEQENDDEDKDDEQIDEDYDSEHRDETSDESGSSDENTSEASGNDNDDVDFEENSHENEPEVEITTIPSSLPNICDGIYDTITSLRGELFVFRDEWVWRFKDTGLLDENYPVKFQQLFLFPQHIERIDAAYERPQDNKIVLFTGSQYWLFDGDKITTSNPLPLSNLSIPNSISKLDAALIWGKNLKTYFFRDDQYWRYDDLSSSMDDGYPKSTSSWRGIPFPINSAFQWTDGNSYFFIDKEFYRFNDQEVVADEHYPLPAFGYWFGC